MVLTNCFLLCTSSESDFEECFICDKPIIPEKLSIVKQRGIQTFIRASKERRDKNYISLEKLEEVKVHKQCQSSYIRQCNIEEAAKRVSNSYKGRRKSISTFQNAVFIAVRG